ncbi:MAG: lysophospholipid acyltransferase family protein [Candidatus Acidiferrales bacterium]
MIRAIAVVLLSAAAIVFCLPWLILWTAITGDPEFMYSTSMKVVHIGVRTAGIRFRVEGVENIPVEACVFACNHASNADGPVMVLAIPRRLSVLIKRELFRIPILSIGMRQAGFVPVDRGAKDGAVNLDEVARHLKDGLSLLVFAEGTRSPDGRLRKLKKGAAQMAIHAGAPIVPVAIAGTPPIIPKGDWRLRPGAVSVRFCPAIDASKYSVEERSQLTERVQGAIASALPADQRPVALSTRPSAS